MSEEARCPKCQGPLSAGGLCPRCAADFLQGAPTEIPGESHSFSPPQPEDLARLFPQLDIIELIGRGGMGAVYKVRQKELDRMAALKILPPGIGQDSGFAERFAREAKALAKLNHPGVVTIYDFGRADGLYFFLMELVDGVNLRQLLERGRISPREALAIVPQICDALQFAHDHGIVHRDIKPDNIMLDRRGRVKVADFGLAKIVASDGPSINLTGAAGPDAPAVASALTDGSKILGTPAYMAPEQVQHPEAVDHRADIYALGMVFYQMLTGQLPAKPIEPPSRKVRIDVRLDEVVLRALEKNPETRYQHASVLKTQVETIAATPSHPVDAETHSQPFVTTMNTNTGKSNWPWAVGGLVAVCLLVFGLAMVHKSVKSKSVKSIHSQAIDYHNLGDARQSKGDLDGAIAAYTKAIELEPDDAYNYLRRGDEKRSKNDWEGAIVDYTKAIELKPDDAYSYHGRGDARQGKNDWDDAIADYTKAIELKADDYYVYLRRGDARQGENDLDGAIVDYTKAIELKPDDAAIYHRRGDAKQGKGDWDGAIADYDNAVELAPDDASKSAGYHRCGDAKLGKSDWDGAIADFTKAVELAPDDAGAYHRRGDAERGKNDWDGAIADYTKAVELKPDDAGAYFNRSLVKKAKGDLDGASADYSKALQLKPDLANH